MTVARQMIFADYHVHSAHSFDSEVPMAFQLETAAERGLSEVCFTDHLEYDFHRPSNPLDLEEYERDFCSLSDGPVRAKFGVEAGISCTDESMEFMKRQIREAPLDFVIASLHEHHNSDPFLEDFFDGWETVALCRDYIAELLKDLKRLTPACFSVVGHIDYLSKGMGARYLPGGKFCYAWASDELDSLFQYLIENGKAIEINTSPYRTIRNGDYPGEDWLRRYVELGGEYVTFGSDAHITTHIAYGFAAAEEVARRAGVRYYATFDRLVPCLQPL